MTVLDARPPSGQTPNPTDPDRSPSDRSPSDRSPSDRSPSDRWARNAAASRMAAASWRALGCTARIVVSDPAGLCAARDAVERVLDAVDLAASRFRTDSELSRLHAAAGARTEISPLFALLLRVSLDAAAWTHGLVDPTVGDALVKLGYDRSFRFVPANGPAVSLVPSPAPGWGLVDLRESEGTVTVPAGVRLDLGATAKGVAADHAARDAAAAAGCGVLVSLGGDVAVAGRAPAGGWPVEVSDVSDDEAALASGPHQTVAVRSGGLATSGVKARRWRRGGSELHHLLDPRLGLPTRGPWRTASVTASTCALANTASTAAMIIGAGAPQWIQARGLAARLVAHDGSISYAGGWPQSADRAAA